MIQTDVDHISPNDKTNISSLSSESITWSFSSFTPIDDRSCTINDSDSDNVSSSNYNNNTEDDNIDWEFVRKQLETVRVETEEENKKFIFFSIEITNISRYYSITIG
jgi:hypothetical protein